MSPCVTRLGLCLPLAASIARAADHLLLTEVAAIPTAGEFIEIHNPTAVPVDLADYYLSDFVLVFDPALNYWRMVDAALVPDPSFPFDFLARFPDWASIGPGETLVVSIDDDVDFMAFWSSYAGTVAPDFELHADGDLVPDMVDPGPQIVGAPFIQSDASLSNAREVVVLFRWNPVSDLVEDVDIVQWSDVGPVFATISPNKTGVAIDGPDADDVESTYLADTPAQDQEVIATVLEIGRTLRRVDLAEGSETAASGNGITGHDETSENLSITWEAGALPTIGTVDEPTSIAPESWGRLKAAHRSGRLLTRSPRP
jgi:hypothetical protein